MRLTRLLPLVSALVAMGVSAAAAQAPMDLAVARAASAGQRPNVIIAYRAGSESRLRTYFEKDLIRGEFPNGMAVDLRSRSVRELAQHPDILNISIDARVSGQQVSLPGATSSSTRDIQNLRATLGITATQTGAGVGIAIIDSGVVPSPDLDASIRAFYDFTNGRRMPTTRNDQYGHGTHVAGLIVGSGARSGGNTSASRLTPDSRLSRCSTRRGTGTRATSSERLNSSGSTASSLVSTSSTSRWATPSTSPQLPTRSCRPWIARASQDSWW